MNRDTILPYALTTLQRVKDRIYDTNAQYTPTGTLNGTTTISAVTPFPACPYVGMAIYGTGIPFGAYITAFSSALSTITISVAATASGTGVALTILNQPVAFDNVLVRMINSCTDWFEREVGGRRFKQTLYTNEVYSAVGPRQKYLVTKQAPITVIISSGNVNAGQTAITGIASTAGMQVGMPIVNCSNLPSNVVPTIVSVDSSTQVTISVAASTTQTGMFFQVNGLVSFQWRSGTPSSPSWTAFIPDQFELQQDGKAGIIRLYGILPRLYDNMARVTYWAGFLINWEFAGDATKHTLPSDVNDTVENLVVRKFKRRQLAGLGSEAFEGATTSWNRELDSDDKDVIGHWRLTPAYL